MSAARAPIAAGLQAGGPTQAQVKVDATSWPTEPRKGWLWVAVRAIAGGVRSWEGRGQDELRALLGDTDRGIVSADRVRAYQLLPHGQRQVGWAQLVRHLVRLLERYADDTRWAQHLLDRTADLVCAGHADKAGWFDQVALQQALIPVRLALHDLLTVGVGSPSPKIAGFSRELLAQWATLWTFSRGEGVAPTTNAAARAPPRRALAHELCWLAQCGRLPVRRADAQRAREVCAPGARSSPA